MGDVTRFPSPPPSASDLSEMRRALGAAPLTSDEIMHGEIATLNEPGPWVAMPGTPLSDDLERLAAIISALLGPGRVLLDRGLSAASAIVYRLRKAAQR